MKVFDDPDNLSFVCWDNGEGISEKDEGRIFEMYFRGSELSTGNGLGLSGEAPHVLACILSDSLRIENAYIISGAAPYNYKGTLKGMWLPVKIIHWIASWEKDKQLRRFIQSDFDSLVNKPEKGLNNFKNTYLNQIRP